MAISGSYEAALRKGVTMAKEPDTPRHIHSSSSFAYEENKISFKMFFATFQSWDGTLKRIYLAEYRKMGWQHLGIEGQVQKDQRS